MSMNGNHTADVVIEWMELRAHPSRRSSSMATISGDKEMA